MTQSNRHGAESSAERPDDIKPFGDNFIPVIPVDRKIHTEEQPFCGNPDCLCHEESDKIAQVNGWYQEGIITEQHAKDIIMGRATW